MQITLVLICYLWFDHSWDFFSDLSCLCKVTSFVFDYWLKRGDGGQLWHTTFHRYYVTPFGKINFLWMFVHLKVWAQHSYDEPQVCLMADNSLHRRLDTQSIVQKQFNCSTATYPGIQKVANWGVIMCRHAHCTYLCFTSNHLSLTHLTFLISYFVLIWSPSFSLATAHILGIWPVRSQHPETVWRYISKGINVMSSNPMPVPSATPVT